MLRKTSFFNLSNCLYVPRTVKLGDVQDSKTEKEKTMSDEAKFTQADLDALKAEHEKAINDLKDEITLQESNLSILNKELEMIDIAYYEVMTEGDEEGLPAGLCESQLL